MKNKILPFSVIIIFGIIFFIFYKGLEDSNIYTPDINTKNDIPVFNTEEFFSGEDKKSSSIFELDKIYLLNIWSSWCVPCRDEHAFLLNLSDSSDLELIGLNYKDKSENAKKFLRELGDPYDFILSDKDGTISIEWGAYGVPETFLIYNKKIIKKIIGPLDLKKVFEINNELVK